jgi:hypothetical protein
MRLWLSKVASYPVVWALTSFEPIPVYRGSVRNAVKTIELSIAVMKEEDNILLFPENPRATSEGTYKKTGVGDFFTGFANIGKMYYKSTGRCTTFYPIFADQKKRTFRIGEGIRYNSGNSARKEKLRIANALRAAMDEMSEICKNT